MNKYTIEVQVNTSQSILMLGDGVAKEFEIKEYVFKSARLDTDKRPGYRYYVSRVVKANNMFEAYEIFMKRLMKVADAMAYFYSQPVAVEYWNILIKKDGDDGAYFSGYELIPATSMSDLSLLDPALESLIDKVEESEDLENTLWICNNAAKTDGVENDPSSHQFVLCQLVESLAEKNHTPKCESCGQGGYARTSRPDMKKLLDKELYNKLFGGSDILRNRLGHGRLVGGKFLTNEDVEDTILKITERINSKYGVSNKVSRSMTDRIRGMMRWYGSTARGIKHESLGLEECLAIEFDDDRNHEGAPITKGW